jgi:uncharacterized membrane protein YphA (DoxX/SURF4 family)
VQRLFSVFPNSWPGFGLLILRTAAGFAALSLSHTAVMLTESAAWIVHAMLLLIACLLWLGLWTPLAAALEALMQVATIALGRDFDETTAIDIALAIGLTMLGPGAWSFDAALFGRKRII